MKYALECTGVSVRFKRYREKNRMIRRTLIDLVKRRTSAEYFWALDNIDFNVRPGETFGIIGDNGSGKSTLLKLISGIMRPDKGTLEVDGKVSALLELGAGFHPELTGRENIYLNGSIMGLTKSQINARFSEILRFSELESFIDTPIKHYSSGMYMRLGFSIAINVDPDILLIDEVLAVGDQAFQQKCMDKIRDFKNRGKTIIFVSHDMNTVNQLCHRAIWLREGKLTGKGTTQRVIDFYREDVNKTEEARLEEDHRQVEEEIRSRWGSREIEITQVQFIDSSGRETHGFKTGDPFQIKISYFARQRIQKPVFGIAIHRNDGTHVNGPNTKFSECVPEYIEGTGAVWYEIDSLPLLPGTYHFTAVVYNYACNHPYDHHDRLYPFKVTPGCTDEEYGVFYIPSRWRYEGSHGKIIT